MNLIRAGSSMITILFLYIHTEVMVVAIDENHPHDDLFRLGVDVGGTFTDCILINSRTSVIVAKAKVPSTPHDPSVGVQVCTRRLCIAVVFI
jgi:activator of 2-hydroxyglutaryl-CoA dehydratase